METLQGGHWDNKHPTCFLPVLQPLLGLHGLSQLEVRGQGVIIILFLQLSLQGTEQGAVNLRTAHWGEGMGHSNGGGSRQRSGHLAVAGAGWAVFLLQCSHQALEVYWGLWASRLPTSKGISSLLFPTAAES